MLFNIKYYSFYLNSASSRSHTVMFYGSVKKYAEYFLHKFSAPIKTGVGMKSTE